MERKRLTYLLEDDPAYLAEAAESGPLRRLKGIGMNCGVEYTSFPRFAGLAPYSRFEHSLDCARIALHFGGNEVQALACLFHDVTSPCFAHVVDFLNGDYQKQESTEKGVLRTVKRKGIMTVLRKYGISPYDVSDYHRFPLCDNQSPRLSCDRLEYTLSNMVNFGVVPLEKAQSFYDDLVFDVADNGVREIIFQSFVLAREFAFAALENSKIYICEEDRGSMEVLAHVLRIALSKGVINENDLMSKESALIKKLMSNPETEMAFTAFTSLRAVSEDGTGIALKVPAKLRYIDPYVKGRGRVSELCPDFKKALNEFLATDFSVTFHLE